MKVKTRPDFVIGGFVKVKFRRDFVIGSFMEVKTGSPVVVITLLTRKLVDNSDNGFVKYEFE